MRPVLGIELGPSRCVLVLVDDRRGAAGAVRVLEHHVVKYEDSGSLVHDLRRLRLAARLPRRARVVIWPLAGDAGVVPVDSNQAAGGFRPDVWRIRERLRPLVRAGFRVSGAVAPAQAVAALAGLGDSQAVVAGLAIDEHAGSLAVVRRGSLVIARELSWKFRAPGEDAPLVDRYAFVAQVLPQLTQALRALEPAGAVDRIVLCGPVPALRALAAPMIEELDVEVETLDGLGGVVFDADPDAAASAQLGAGAAVSGRHVSLLPGLGVRPVLTPVRVMVGTAAAAVVIVLVLLFWPAPQASKPRNGGADGVREPVSRGSRA